MQHEAPVYTQPRTPLRAKQVAERLGIGISTWYDWVKAKLVIPGRKVSHKMVIWDSDYIDGVMSEMLSGEFTTEGLYAEKKG